MADLSSMRRLLVTLALVIALCIAIPGGSAGAAESGLRTYRHNTCGHSDHGRELAAVLALHAGGDAGDLRRRSFLADAA